MAVTTEIDVRYRDLDTLGHVNNAVYATYVEMGRTAYADEVFSLDLEETPIVVASLTIDFERRVTLEDGVVEVTTEVPELGRSSVQMDTELTVDGERAASAETTLVFVDREASRPASLPDDVREQIEAEEGL